MVLSYKKVTALIATTVTAAFLLGSCAPYQAHKGSVHFKQRGKASWYGPGFAGRKTANGERFNPSALTAAHRKLPFNTTVRVTNLENGKSVVVRINDRGPYAGRRVIDLSKAAAQKIGLLKSGVDMVEIESIGPADKNTIIAKQTTETVRQITAPEPGIKLAARSVRRNGVEHLISIENKEGDPLPSETIEDTELSTDTEAISEVKTKTTSIEDSFSVSSKKSTDDKAGNTITTTESYSADEDDF